MIVEIAENPDWSKENIDYIQRTGLLTDQLLGVASPSGYIMSEEDNQDLESPYPGLGKNETELLNYMVYTQQFRTVAYVGGLGTGKSALISFIYSYLIQRCGYTENFKDLDVDSPKFVIKFDVNGLVKEEKNQLEFFEDKLFRDFRIIVAELYKNSSLIESFVQFISTNRLKHEWFAFYEFFEDVVQDPSTEWNSSNTIRRQRCLMEWIKAFPTRTHQYLVVRLLLKYYLIYYKPENEKHLIVIFDDIDTLDEDIQGKFLSNVLQISHDTRIRVIVALRETTLGKYVGNGAYQFNFLSHSGPDPVTVLKIRIKHFLENPLTPQYKEAYDRLRLDKPNGQKYFDAWKTRLKTLLYFLENGNRLNTLINALCGLSTRKALDMCQHLFYTSIVHWSNNALPEDMIIQILLVNSGKGIRIPPDSAVENLFRNHKGQNSLIKLRILDFLYQRRMWSILNKDEDHVPLLGELIAHLQLFQGFTDDEIFAGVADLMKVAKALVVVPGVKEYDDKRNFYQSVSDKIHISNCGIGYFEKVVYNLQYLQNASYSVFWNIESVSNYRDNIRANLKRILGHHNHLAALMINLTEVKGKLSIQDFMPTKLNDNVMNERLGFLRQSLGVLLLADLYQTSNFVGRNTDVHFRMNSLLIGRIIEAAESSVSKIYRVVGSDQEILNWSSLKTEVQNWNEVLFERNGAK